MEAEYISVALGLKSVIAIRQVLKEFGVNIDSPMILHEDNKACIDLANNPESRTRSKHIDIRYHFIREHVRASTIKMAACPTTLMKADLLTKPLESTKFERLRELMGIVKINQD